jgi:hypothetical protein
MQIIKWLHSDRFIIHIYIYIWMASSLKKGEKSIK